MKIENLLQHLKGKKVLCYPHHEIFTLIDPAVETNTEICASWDPYIEKTCRYDEYLKKGNKFGFIGSSDTHRCVPGLGGALTGVIAEELTPDSLREAYARHRTVVTQGFPLFLDFRVNGTLIGEHVRTKKPPRLEIQVEARREITSLQIRRGGETIRIEYPQSKQYNFSFTDTGAPAGNGYYYLRIELVPEFTEDDTKTIGNLATARGNLAWSSPIFITYQSREQG